MASLLRRAACSAAAGAASTALRLPLRRALSSASSSSSAAPAPPASQKIVRFQDEAGEEHFGVFTDATEARCRVARRGGAGAGAAGGRMQLTDEEVVVDLVLPPVDPPAVYCIGLNYVDHAAEVKMAMPAHPIVFTKPCTALTGHGSAIVIPRVAAEPPEVDYEAELAVVIGRECKNVPASRAMDYVLGYTIANDVTARRWQGAKRGGGQWARGKGFDTFLPLGPCIVPKAEVPDPHALRIRTLVNGDTVQDGNTSSMFFKIPQLIEFLSQGTTLLPGTVICTGTPAGVGYTRGVYLKRGDVVAIYIDGIGCLRNTVAAELGDSGLIEH